MGRLGQRAPASASQPEARDEAQLYPAAGDVGQGGTRVDVGEEQRRPLRCGSGRDPSVSGRGGEDPAT